jgi:flagellar basal-body rod modification protein FlgD
MEITGVPPRANQSHVESRTAQFSAAAPTLGYDSFLKLLIAQIQNQDPLEPMSSSDYVAQLATFSQVEKSVQTNERITELLATSRFQQAEGLLGRTVTSADGTVTGSVSAVRVSGAEVIVTLANGGEISIVDGVTIS